MYETNNLCLTATRVSNLKVRCIFICNIRWWTFEFMGVYPVWEQRWIMLLIADDNIQLEYTKPDAI